MNKKFSAYDDLFQRLGSRQHTWLITGVAGFIGSNLLETLLKLDQKVVGIDNFSTGYQDNLDEVKAHVSNKQWSNFQFTKGDIRDIGHCHLVCSGVEFVLHQAALGSVSRSIEDPINTNSVNIVGFLNMLIASRDAKVKSFVYAASSSTYGDHPDLPKTEDKIGKPLSPYAVTKYVNELYADVFAKCYEFKTIGLRYFNVFGPRQNPSGAYAAVIPRWVASMLTSESIYINGDGQSSRDFTYVENVIQANLLAAMANDQARNQIYNVAAGEQTTLNQLFNLIAQSLRRYIDTSDLKPIYRDFRPADVRHSLADISKARNFLGYNPTHTLMDGIPLACEGYLKNFRVDQ